MKKLLLILSRLYLIAFVGYFVLCIFAGTMGFFGEQPTLLDGFNFAIELYWDFFIDSCFTPLILAIVAFVYCRRNGSLLKRGKGGDHV